MLATAQLAPVKSRIVSLCIRKRCENVDTVVPAICHVQVPPSPSVATPSILLELPRPYTEAMSGRDDLSGSAMADHHRLIILSTSTLTWTRRCCAWNCIEFFLAIWRKLTSAVPTDRSLKPDEFGTEWAGFLSADQVRFHVRQRSRHNQSDDWQERPKKEISKEASPLRLCDGA
jgi:hypothetical protein